MVIGAGGFGRETIDLIRSINIEANAWDILGALDDAPSRINRARLERMEVPLLGSLDHLMHIGTGVRMAVAIGTPRSRESVVAQLDLAGYTSPNLFHPTAAIGSQFQPTDGAIVCANVSIGTNTSLGRHAHLNPHAVIGHDVTVGNFVSVNPNATVSGDCFLGNRVLVGAGSVVLQGLSIGEGSVIGASACVTTDVQPESTVKGVPAK